MANQIKTRILLRNDTLANWEAAGSVALGKGEVAIADLGSNKFEVRVGNGATTWANSMQLNVNAANISGLIDTIKGTAGKYRVVQDGTNAKWTLQTCPISATDDSEWTDVNVAIDLESRISGIESDISYLSGAADYLSGVADYLSDSVDYLSGVIDDTRSTLDTVSSDYLTSADKTELSNALTALDDAKLAKSEFAALSNEIGLSAASAENPVVTKNDIADLAGAMHFRGAVTPTEGQSDVDAITAYYAAQSMTPEAGDVVIITTDSKEYVYNGTNWVELGDEALYATKAEVSSSIEALSTELYGQLDSLSDTVDANVEALSTELYGQLDSLSDTVVADYATKALLSEVSADTLTSANAYTDSKIEDLDLEDSGTGFVTVVTQTDGQVAVTKKTIELSDITDYEATISAYATKAELNDVSVALSTDYVEKIATAKSEAITSAETYTDDQISATLDEYFILDCGTASLRTNEPEFTA